MQHKAIVLLSGGLDSTTVLAMARSEGRELNALTFDYGQRHKEEIEAAKSIAARYEAKHHIVRVSLFGGSVLTSGGDVPKDRTEEEIGTGIPSTYVPGRNTIFLAFAMSWAETIGAQEMFLGVNALDYSGYPDCRPEYITAFQQVVEQATLGRVSIRTPILHMTKQEIINMGRELGVDYSQTISCYDYHDGACGRCDACLLRKKGFLMAGMVDPTRYAT